MSWIYLIVAGLFEVAFTSCMGKVKETTGSEMYWWFTGFLISMSISMFLLIKATQALPIGTAYAVWTGIGAVGTVLAGILIFKEPATVWRLLFIVTLIGWFIGRKFLKVDRDTSYLISSGTAICGGSAIAAVGPVLRAKDTEMSVALGTIFILNAIALFIFPVIGHALDMSQQEFGTWAAIAIHDTSSVVGAGAAYGEEALQIATTIKLTRALWIIPLALITSFVFKSKGQKISIPWFIFFFILAMVFNTYVLSSSEAGIMIGEGINSLARKILTITLFFIGASLSRDVLKAVGIKPLIQGVLLWITISVSTLAYIYWF